MTNLDFNDYLISFGHGTKREKSQILLEHQDKKVIMDLTCFDPEEFYQNHTNLIGSFSALLCHSSKKIEINLKEKNDLILNKFRELGYIPIETHIISFGFIYPRTIAQIINEAYYALEEGVATKEDMNRAMKFGVNYPQGPFEWAEGKENIILALLEGLLEKTRDKRYVPSKLLQDQAQLISN